MGKAAIQEKKPAPDKLEIFGYSPMVLGALIFTTLSWGSSFAIAKYAMTSLQPINLAALRFLIGGLMFLPILVYWQRRENIKISREDWPKLGGLAILGVAFYFYIQYTGLSLTTASNASLIIATSPIFVGVLAAYSLGETLTFKKIAGIALAFIGVIGVVANGTLSSLFDRAYLMGNLLMLFNSFCWAIFTIGSKKMIQKYSAIIVTGYITLMGGLMLVPISLYRGVLHEAAGINGAGWAAVLFLAVFCSVGGYLGWQYALSQVDATKTAIFLYLQPLVTVVVALGLLGEQLTVFTLLGGGLILYGVALSAKG